MKRITPIMYAAIAISLASCSNTTENTPYLETYVSGLVEQYPNFKSNEIASSAIQDSVRIHASSLIGKPCKDIEGLDFKFKDIREGENGKCATFVCNRFAIFDAPTNSDKENIATDIQLVAFGVVSDEVAAKLDGNCTYHLSGVLHAVDEKDFLLAAPLNKSPFFFGIYILENLQAEEI